MLQMAVTISDVFSNSIDADESTLFLADEGLAEAATKDPSPTEEDAFEAELFAASGAKDDCL